MARKKYSPMERYQFHRKRLIDSKTTDYQKAYSKNWVEGFEDDHAKVNYSALKNSKAYRKRIGKYDKDYSVMINGSLAGTKARIDSGISSIDYTNKKSHC